MKYPKLPILLPPHSDLAMLGSPILDSSLNNCGGNGGGGGGGGGALGGGGDLADCYSPKLNDSYRGTKI